MIETGLNALLLSTAAITNLVGQNVYHVVVDKDATYPAISFQLISTVSQPTFTSAGMQRARVQFDIWGNEDAGFSPVDAIRKVLIGLLNGMSRVTLADGTFLQGAQLITTSSTFEDQALLRRCMVDFYFWFVFPS